MVNILVVQVYYRGSYPPTISYGQGCPSRVGAKLKSGLNPPPLLVDSPISENFLVSLRILVFDLNTL